MARMTTIDALETKIEKAQEQVSKAKKQYDTALAKLVIYWINGMHSEGMNL